MPADRPPVGPHPVADAPAPVRRRSRARLAGALLLTVLVVLGAVVATAQPAGATTVEERKFLNLLNAKRTTHHRRPLVLDERMSYQARRWSRTMARRNDIPHTPHGQLVRETAQAQPYWRSIGENVGHGPDVAGLHRAFWRSSSHRKNMLGRFNRVGIGAVRSEGQTWVTFRFAWAQTPEFDHCRAVPTSAANKYRFTCS